VVNTEKIGEERTGQNKEPQQQLLAPPAEEEKKGEALRYFIGIQGKKRYLEKGRGEKGETNNMT